MEAKILFHNIHIDDLASLFTAAQINHLSYQSALDILVLTNLRF